MAASKGRAPTRRQQGPSAQPAPLRSPGIPLPTGVTVPPIDPGQVLKQHFDAVTPILHHLEQMRGSTVITYFLRDGAQIADDAVVQLFGHLKRLGKCPQIDLYLYSHGGETEVPWRIVSMVREFTDKFCVLLPYHAESAATHISLGADEIVMTEIAQLGPVDPSRRHPLLPPDPYLPAGEEPRPLAISVQDLRHFVQFIEKEGDADDKPADLTAIYIELMRHVHPLVIGAMEQSYAMARLMTKNMLGLHMDPVADADVIDSLATRMADDFKSHRYPINRREAAAMGLKVVATDPALRDAMWSLWEYYNSTQIQAAMKASPPPPGLPPAKDLALASTCFVDSSVGSAAGFLATDTSGKLVGPAWLSYFP